MKRFLFLTCIALLSACQSLAVNSRTVIPSEEVNSSFSTPIKASATQTPFITSTDTLVPSETPSPTETATQFPAKFFNPTVIQTITPSLPAQCPPEDAKLQFSVEDLDTLTASAPAGQQNQYFTKYILDFINSGGTLHSILSAYQELSGEQMKTYLRATDVTGDNIEELVFAYGIWLDVFGCKAGKYELTFTDTYESDLSGVDIIDVTDINHDGLVEMIVSFNGCMGNRCPIILVYEWNSDDFQNLIADESCTSLHLTPYEVIIRDTDNNGTKEIILRNKEDPWPDDIAFPLRKETHICMWNGQNFVVYKSQFDAPYYRFQAVQDGDRATLAGDYDIAFSFYQRTINDKKLQWFTQDRKRYDFWIYRSKYFPSFQEPTPTASPSMVQDPNEYPNLAAYAYYRIMVLYILQNNTAKAQSTFSTLQSQFPTGSPGNYFAQVASSFWQEYQSSMNTQSSCRKVVEYAQEHSLPIQYLGDWDHGAQSIHYTPELICPFQ